MSPKVLVTTKALTDVGSAATQLLREAGCELIIASQSGPYKGETLTNLLAGKDAVLATIDHYTAEVFASPAASQIKIISRWGVGVETIDAAAATKAGVIVAYTPGLLNDTVADLAFALILAVARRVQEGHALLQQGRWQQLWGSNVHGKTLGLLGCGRIGQATARRAKGFDMRLLGYDLQPAPEAERLGIKFVTLDELLAESDFLSLHASFSSANRGLIGEAQLRKMKRTAFLINTARGALIDEPVLVRALEEGWIAGAGLDTFAVEPLAANHPLLRLPNVVLTPHQASCTRETGERVSLTAAQAIVDVMNGRRPQLVLNPEVFSSPACRAKVS
jgi:glyoxylate reductase